MSAKIANVEKRLKNKTNNLFTSSQFKRNNGESFVSRQEDSSKKDNNSSSKCKLVKQKTLNTDMLRSTWEDGGGLNFLVQSNRFQLNKARNNFEVKADKK